MQQCIKTRYFLLPGTCTHLNIGVKECYSLNNYLTFGSAAMNNRPIIITGSQRSGTTLLNLILDSHPQIHGVDEMNFRNNTLQEYLELPSYHPCVSLKLPALAHDLPLLKSLPRLKIFWCIRDPRDVVLSMTTLTLKINEPQRVIWANHPLGALREIRNCMQALGYDAEAPSFIGSEEYMRISRIPYLSRGRKEAVFMASLCWSLKNELLDLYSKNNIPYMLMSYEDLISDPESMLKKLLTYIDLPWHDNVLRHHELQKGMSIGRTVNTRPIDSSNTGKWVNEFNEDELAVVESVCSGIAQKFGYQFPGSLIRSAVS
jgi:Sulfotransferase domain